jgi:hypothetical protein
MRIARRLWLYDVIAAPGYAWLWICARLVGSRMAYGPGDPADEPFDWSVY